MDNLTYYYTHSQGSATSFYAGDHVTFNGSVSWDNDENGSSITYTFKQELGRAYYLKDHLPSPRSFCIGDDNLRATFTKDLDGEGAPEDEFGLHWYHYGARHVNSQL